MAFLKFGKKKKEDPFDIPMPPPEMNSPPPKSDSPIDQVLMMKQQGYTNNQIVQMLQSQGYNTTQVYDAINKANLSTDVQSVQQPEMGMADYGKQDYQQFQQQPLPQAENYQPPNEIQAPVSIDEERIQEVAEAIIDEKWNEFSSDIRRVIEWKDRSEDRIAKIEQQLIDMRMSIDSLSKSIISKISSYDQSIVDVGTEVKAMEKVFQKVLPNLTESVNKLDRMTKGYKDSPAKK